MSFASWSEFFAMGGYALYVWGSYGVSALALGTVLLAPLWRRRELERAARRQQRRATQPKDAAGGLE